MGLGISAVIINDLKHKKTKNYDFDWESALQNTGKSGIKLQYTHCRLCNLFEVNQHLLSNSNDLNFDLIQEPDALKLILTLAKFEEALADSYKMMEPSILAKYLFGLCSDINRALQVLAVKGSDVETADVRLKMFCVAQSAALWYVY